MTSDPDNPVKILFGAGALERIGELVKGRSYALLTYPDPPFDALARRIALQAGMPALLFDAILPNPSLLSLRELCERHSACGREIELCVALGGGSVMDTAKAFALSHGRYDRLDAALQGRPPENEALPVVAIPTTAGTGSEVTCWATLWDTQNGRKLSLERTDLYPETAIIDPTLMLGLPAAQTLSCALDALSHALESLWNHNANRTSRLLAIDAARHILGSLPLVVERPGDLDARSRLAEGALQAGLAFSHTRTALAHSLSYPLTLRHGVTHGLACSFSLPAVMRAALGMSAECDEALGRIFDCVPDHAPAALENILTGLGVPLSPAAFGVSTEEWTQIVAEAHDGPRGRNFIGRQDAFPDLFAARTPANALRDGEPA